MTGTEKKQESHKWSEEVDDTKINPGPSSHGNGLELSHVREAIEFEAEVKHNLMYLFVRSLYCKETGGEKKAERIVGTLLLQSECFTLQIF